MTKKGIEPGYAVLLSVPKTGIEPWCIALLPVPMTGIEPRYAVLLSFSSLFRSYQSFVLCQTMSSHIPNPAIFKFSCFMY